MMRLIVLAALVLPIPLYAAVPQFWFEPAARSGNNFVARGPSGLFTFAEGEVAFKLGRGATVQIAFPGSRAGAKPEAGALLPGKTNYFLGSASHWRVAVEQYGEVRYRALYPGVDLVFHATGAEMNTTLSWHRARMSHASICSFTVPGVLKWMPLAIS